MSDPTAAIRDLMGCVILAEGPPRLNLTTITGQEVARRIVAAVDLIDRLASDVEYLRAELETQGCQSP